MMKKRFEIECGALIGEMSGELLVECQGNLIDGAEFQRFRAGRVCGAEVAVKVSDSQSLRCRTYATVMQPQNSGTMSLSCDSYADQLADFGALSRAGSR
jgi:hypothetical protein